MGRERDELAEAAVAPIESGMIVGLGTGRAAGRGIRALAARVRDEGLRADCVVTSARSQAMAVELGLRPIEMRYVERVDYLFDGADEVDGELRMIKGGGGAMTREKIVARASVRRVYLVQRAKIVERLGARAPLPVEVLPFALGAVTRLMRERLPLKPTLRLSASGDEPVVTDNGSLIVDAALDAGVDLADLARALDELPGVVGHGLFLDEADEVLIEEQTGLTRRTR